MNENNKTIGVILRLDQLNDKTEVECIQEKNKKYTYRYVNGKHYLQYEEKRDGKRIFCINKSDANLEVIVRLKVYDITDYAGPHKVVYLPKTVEE